ncbi:MAG: hypothetical protein HY762_07520 [Planctomycetes bacterium]|nr:hypothetical protein [Planctomycetota bacterium]
MVTCKGLTLIEILIALIVLLIGVVSILALFPNAIRSTRTSIEDTVCAKIADSVCDALTIAMRSSIPENRAASKPAQATLVHDGLPGDNTSYTFALPLPVDSPLSKPRFFAHPAADPMNVTTVTPKPNDAFKLGTTAFFKDIVKDIRENADPTETYDQYGFAVTVSRVDDVRAAEETGDKFKPKPLYQFAIAIYRLPPAPSGGGTYGYKPGELPDPLRVFVVQLAGQ